MCVLLPTWYLFYNVPTPGHSRRMDATCILLFSWLPICDNLSCQVFLEFARNVAKLAKMLLIVCLVTVRVLIIDRTISLFFFRAVAGWKTSTLDTVFWFRKTIYLTPIRFSVQKKYYYVWTKCMRCTQRSALTFYFSLHVDFLFTSFLRENPTNPRNILGGTYLRFTLEIVLDETLICQHTFPVVIQSRKLSSTVTHQSTLAHIHRLGATLSHAKGRQ